MRDLDLLVEGICAIAEMTNTDPEETAKDFIAFSKAVDMLIELGASEEDALAIVGREWDFSRYLPK